MSMFRRGNLLGKRLALGGLAILGLLASALPNTERDEPAQGAILPVAAASEKPIRSAYVADSDTLVLKSSDGALLDQLNFSFALIKNGRASGAHWQNIEAYKAFISKNPHIRPVLSIGGWGADGFSQACATQAGREKLADSLIELMNAHSFTGVDIDWEYPCSSAAGIASSKSDRGNFTLLLRELRKRLDALTAQDGKSRMLAIAVGGDPAMTKYIECQEVASLVDQVNLMTYDLHAGSATSTHHAALYSTSGNVFSAHAAVKAYTAAGIPARKIMLGAAFYGRGWTNVPDMNNGIGQITKQGSLKLFTYKKILDLIDSGASKARYDEDAQAAYLFDGSTFISYDNERSIRAKGEYVKNNGLMGLMCWEYGSDVNSRLLTSLSDSLTR